MDNFQENTAQDAPSDAPHQVRKEQVGSTKISWQLIVSLIIFIVVIGIAWQFTGAKKDVTPVAKPMIKEKEVAPVLPIEPVVEVVVPDIAPQVEIPEPEEVIEVVESTLPLLDDSDDWLKTKLPTLTWRKELLKLVIDDDMIRRFVVFTDNFAQGIVAYEHSPFVKPNEKFSPDLASEHFDNKHSVWQWNEQSSTRFGLYVDLLRSFESESLIEWYIELKPLIDQAYSELGYNDDDFTTTLQDAITRVLDMELPKTTVTIIRPSVMYQYQDTELESLPDADKLLLRLGRENLLVIKSVLLELNEKLAQEQNGIH
ncbi:MAG: DUF3014 domain-containing protein [Colwellia sp.]